MNRLMKELIPDSVSSAAALGILVVAGWLAHDYAVFLTSGQPDLIGFFVLGSGIALVTAGILGVALTRLPLLLPVLAIGLAIASIVPKFVELALPRPVLWLPRSSLLILVAFCAASVLCKRFRFSVLRAGLASGALMCLGKTVGRLGLEGPSTQVAIAAVCAFGLGFVGKAGIRRIGTAVVVFAPLAWLGSIVAPDITPARKDLAWLEGAPERTEPNLLLIVLDTVRADRMSAYGYELETTPGMDAFVDEHATIYTSARSTAPWTLPSHASMFTGLFPAEHGAFNRERGAAPLRKGIPTIASILRKFGYDTGAIVANCAYMNHRYGLDLGFRTYDDRCGGYVDKYIALPQMTGSHLREGNMIYRDAKTVTDRAQNWLDERDDSRPFFLMLNYFDVHYPYAPPAPFAEQFSDVRPPDPVVVDVKYMSIQYDRELLYLDHHVTRLLDDLRRRGLFDETAIVITSDHGESIGDHGVWFHEWTLYEELVHVPLFVKPVGERTQKRIDAPFVGREIFNLSLELVGLPPVPREVPIQGLFGQWYQGVYKEGSDVLSWLEGDLKYIVHADGRIEAYDLALDPGELTSLEPTEEDRTRLIAMARKWWDDHAVQGERAVTIDAETLETMQALGYMGE